MRAHPIPLAFLVALAAGCQVPPPGTDKQSLGGAPAGGAQFENAPQNDTDPFQVTNLPPTVSTRLHSCQKIPYESLGNLLVSRGMNMNGTAGKLYQAGAVTLGQ